MAHHSIGSSGLSPKARSAGEPAFLVFVAPRVTQSLHPQTVINPQGKILMDAPTRAVFFGALFGFSGLFLWLLSLEARLERLARSRRNAGRT